MKNKFAAIVGFLGLFGGQALAVPTQTPQWGFDPASTFATQPYNQLQYKIGTTWTAIPLLAQYNIFTAQVSIPPNLNPTAKLPNGATNPYAYPHSMSLSPTYVYGVNDGLVQTYAYGGAYNNVLLVEADKGIAATFGTHTSANITVNEENAAVNIFAFQDKPSALYTGPASWAAYMENRRYPGANGPAVVQELDLTEFNPSVVQTDPYKWAYAGGSISAGIYLQSGGSCGAGGYLCYNPATGLNNLSAYDAGVALAIGNNNAAFKTGIQFNYNALTGNDGQTDGQSATAIAMPRGDTVSWFYCNNTTAPYPSNCGGYTHGADIISTIKSAAAYTRMFFDDTFGFILTNSANKFMFRTAVSSSYVNGLYVNPSVAGNAVTIGTAGDDTNINLQLTPQGSGIVQTGAASFKTNGVATQAGLNGSYSGNNYFIEFNAAKPYLWIDATNFGAIPSTGVANTWTATQTFTSAAPQIILGANGGNGASFNLKGSTSGTATIATQAAAGTPTLTLPNTSGTLVSTASSPLSINATTGAISVTGAAGQILAGATPAFTATPTLGVNATTTGQLGFANGGATGATVTVQNNGATTAYNFNLPTTVGTAGYLLTSQAGGSTAMTWTSPTTTVNGTACTLGSTCTVTAAVSSIPFPQTVSGTVTSGGIPYFNSTTQMSSSALLAQYQLVVGGGAGAAPATLGATGSSGQHLQSGGAAANPSWTTATFPATTTAGTILASGTANTVTATATPTLGASGTLGSLTMGNATSGTVTLQPVTGALGTVTASLPANTGTIAELNLAQTWSATQTFTTPVLGAATGTSLALGGATLGTNTLAVQGSTTQFTSSSSYMPQLQAYNSSNDISAGYFILDKSRGAGATPTAVAVGDALGNFIWRGADGTNATPQNSIIVAGYVDSVAAGAVTGHMIWSSGGQQFYTVNSAPNSNQAFSVGTTTTASNLITYPAFNVDVSTASSSTGLNVKSLAAGSGLALSTRSSGTNENMTIDAKGTGNITLNGTATGSVILGSTGAAITVKGQLLVSAAAPTLSSCGTSPVIAAGSSNNNGQFTTGSATGTACTITFATAFPTYAYCTVSRASATAGSTFYISASSRTAFTVTTTVSSQTYNYTCMGN